LDEHVEEWMKTAELIAIGGFSQVKEDGPDVGSLESDSEHSDHGEMWEDKEAYTVDMIGPDGKKTSGPVKLTPEQVAAQRALFSIPRSMGPMVSLNSDINARLTTQTPSNSDEDAGTLTELRKAKRIATKGIGPPRSLSVDSETGSSGGLVAATDSEKTDMRATRSCPSKT
jgi:hypothetical protein